MNQSEKYSSNVEEAMTQALSFFQEGLLEKAKQTALDVLIINSRSADALHLLGVISGLAGEHAQAELYLKEAADIDLSNHFVYFNLAKALSEQGKDRQALVIHQRALILNEKHDKAWLNYGKSLAALSKFQEAIKAYDIALQLNPVLAEAVSNTACCLSKLGLHHDSLALHDRAVSLNPHQSEFWNNRGVALEAQGRYIEAIESYDRALAMHENFSEAWSNRGAALVKIKQYAEALISFDHSISFKSDNAEAWSNRGVALNYLSRYAEALVSYDRSIVLRPDDAKVWCNLGVTLSELGRNDEALISYGRSIELNPDYSESYRNKAMLKLRLGDFDEGWILYEWRWRCDDNALLNREVKQPLWLGETSLSEKKILLQAEQGLGDTIQFSRYVAMVKKLGAMTVLEVPKELKKLFSRLEGVDILIARGEQRPSVDYYCPLMSLPLAFKTTKKSIPQSVPYLFPIDSRVKYWKQYLGKIGFKIAICWQGNPATTIDFGRSFPVKLFEKISRIKNVRLISLQKNYGIEQLSYLPSEMVIEELPKHFDCDPFLDSAAVMRCVDLVITSDTALTHLAGALGVRTWLLLKKVPDWRWMLDLNNSPWYPKHRLFRQEKLDDWSDVFVELEREIVSLIKNQDI